jgi:hypothetical protein
MKKLLFLPLVLISFISFSQDAKEKIGKLFKIGNLLVGQINGKLTEEQIWSTSNLNGSKFQNGGPIFEPKTEAKWNKEIWLDDFFGCWLLGINPNDVLPILEVKPKCILIVHRTDLGEYGQIDEHASYKIIGSKIKFRTHFLFDNNYHIENTNNEIFLVEEYPLNFRQKYRGAGAPNKFKKIRCKKNLPNEWLN